MRTDEEIIRDSGFFRPEAVKQIARLIDAGEKAGDKSPRIARSICEYGVPASDEEKEGLGFAKGVVVGRAFLEALTKPGGARAPEVPKVIVKRVQHHRRLTAEIATMRESGLIDWVEIVDCGDGKHCSAVAELVGKWLPIAEVPELPLAGCDADSCYCVYTATVE